MDRLNLEKKFLNNTNENYLKRRKYSNKRKKFDIVPAEKVCKTYKILKGMI